MNYYHSCFVMRNVKIYIYHVNLIQILSFMLYKYQFIVLMFCTWEFSHANVRITILDFSSDGTSAILYGWYMMRTLPFS